MLVTMPIRIKYINKPGIVKEIHGHKLNKQKRPTESNFISVMLSESVSNPTVIAVFKMVKLCLEELWRISNEEVLCSKNVSKFIAVDYILQTCNTYPEFSI